MVSNSYQKEQISLICKELLKSVSKRSATPMFLFFAKNRSTVHNREIPKTLKHNEKMCSLIPKSCKPVPGTGNTVMNKKPKHWPL